MDTMTLQKFALKSVFEENQPIPAKYSADGENASPPIHWSGVPEKTRSLALIVTDPNAPSDRPFVHWVVYNIPPVVGGLPEGLPQEVRLVEPAGAIQGVNSRGTVGYFGPRPPQGDPPHHYHFRLYALDTLLELDANLASEITAQAVSDTMYDREIGLAELVGTFHRV
jgi:Raf kinase inhibitor-like YbhB/YbcL family protein